MKPAVRRAAAFVYLTGSRPAHIRYQTSGALWDVAAYVPDAREIVPGVRVGEYQVKPEWLERVRADPLAQAGDWFKERGFKVESPSGRARTTHYVAYRKAGCGDVVEWEGLAYRQGGGSVTATFDRLAGVPYRCSWKQAELDKAWPALLRPAMYVGERPSWEHPAAYLKRAVAAYLAA